jgi:hypothetical protein
MPAADPIAGDGRGPLEHDRRARVRGVVATPAGPHGPLGRRSDEVSGAPVGRPVIGAPPAEPVEAWLGAALDPPADVALGIPRRASHGRH